MTSKKSMNELRERANEIASKMNVLRPKADRAHELAAKWAERARQLDDKMHHHSEVIAGLNGHLAMGEFGATQYEIIRDGQYSIIRFYNDAGEEIRNPHWPKEAL